jgi:SAM-dependent methyltransferase
MADAHDDVVLDHYREQAHEHGLDPTSTMADQITRQREVDAIVACVAHVLDRAVEASDLLEVGCGNGYLLQALRERFPTLRLTGAEWSPDMVELAAGRALASCEIRREDVRALTFPAASFDVVVSERCLINVLDAAEQDDALRELHRVLKPGGYLVLVEAFVDGAINLNRARDELGLPPIPVPHHNLWFEEARFTSVIEGRLEKVGDTEGVPPGNFLSTHYFISRVLYPSVTRREVLYNTEFVRFFEFLPPRGDYSPIRLFLLRSV